MKIIIKAAIDSESNDVDIVLTNDGLGNLNFVELVTHDNSESYMISTDDLATAVDAFREDRRKAYEHDRLFEPVFKPKESFWDKSKNKIWG